MIEKVSFDRRSSRKGFHYVLVYVRVRRTTVKKRQKHNVDYNAM